MREGGNLKEMTERRKFLNYQLLYIRLNELLKDFEGRLGVPVAVTPVCVECPFCGDDCIHIEAVNVNCGGEITTIDRSGTKLQAGDPDGRGASVLLVLWCESCLHKWQHRWFFHKGQTLVEDKMLSDGPVDYDQVNTLWRD